MYYVCGGILHSYVVHLHVGDGRAPDVTFFFLQHLWLRYVRISHSCILQCSTLGILARLRPTHVLGVAAPLMIKWTDRKHVFCAPPPEQRNEQSRQTKIPDFLT